MGRGRGRPFPSAGMPLGVSSGSFDIMAYSSIGVAVVATGRDQSSSLRHMSAGKKNVPPEPTISEGTPQSAVSRKGKLRASC
jgi:hypothetical protein